MYLFCSSLWWGSSNLTSSGNPDWSHLDYHNHHPTHHSKSATIAKSKWLIFRAKSGGWIATQHYEFHKTAFKKRLAERWNWWAGSRCHSCQIWLERIFCLILLLLFVFVIVGSPEKENTRHVESLDEVQTVTLGSHPATPNFAQPVVPTSHWSSPDSSTHPALDLVRKPECFLQVNWLFCCFLSTINTVIQWPWLEPSQGTLDRRISV